VDVHTVKVGIPSEVKNHEYRVAITPAGVHELVRGGHQVLI
jgi:alanine dehydrogenase